MASYSTSWPLEVPIVATPTPLQLLFKLELPVNVILYATIWVHDAPPTLPPPE